jgi:phosphoserine phosphatase RsbU/P
MPAASSRLVGFARRQQSYVAVGVAIYVAMWGAGIHAAVGPLLIYALWLCNVTVALQDRLDSLCSGYFSLRRWLIFGVALLGVAFVAVTAVNLVEYPLLRGPGQSLWQFLRNGWKMPFVAALIFGMSSQFYRTMRERLEARNRELQRNVELEMAERELQAQELEQAREIQRNLLPKEIPQLPGFEIACAWEPARVVGGDYFDVIKLSETSLGICIADVVGKSVSAALLMANVQASVRAFATESTAPSLLCARVNSVLCSNIASGKFVTLFYGVIDARNYELRYTNAGHLPPILANADGKISQLENSGALLGVFPDWKYEDSKVALRVGDRLLLFTDGITEASTSDEQEFGEGRLSQLLRDNLEKSASELKRLLLGSVTDFCEAHFHDDATLIAISVIGPGTAESCPPLEEAGLIHTS